MTQPTESIDNRREEIALLIFIEMIKSSSFLFEEGIPENYAKISFKYADAFLSAKQSTAANNPEGI